MSIKFAPGYLLTLSFLLCQPAKADELSDLRVQLDKMAKKIQEIELSNKINKKNQKSSTDYIVRDSVFEEKLSERMQKIELENNELKLTSKNSVKSGSLPGSFLIPGTDTSLKIYGYVKVDGIYSSRAPGGDASASYASSNFLAVPLKGTPVYKQGSEFAATARESRFGIDSQTVLPKGKVGTRIEGDFYGSGSNFHLRKAYIDYVIGNHEFLFGQQGTIFADGSSTDDSETLDFGGITGTPGGRVPMIRYAYQFSPVVKLMLALEEPDTTYKDTSVFVSDAEPYNYSLKSLDSSSGNTVERMPDAIIHLKLGDQKAHISFRGLVTQQSYDDTVYKKRILGYGVAHSGHYTFSNNDNFAYDLIYGNALDGWMDAGTGAILDSTTDPKKKNFFLQNNLGLAVSFKHMWTDTLRSTLGLGMLRTYNKGIMKSLQVNKFVRDLHINLVESPVKNFDVGMEYAVGERHVEKARQIPGLATISDVGVTHRFQISAKYSF